MKDESIQEVFPSMATVLQLLSGSAKHKAGPAHLSDYAPLPSVWFGEDAELLEQLLGFYPRKKPRRILDATVNGGRFWQGSKCPVIARQVRFYQLLVGARKQWFIDALSEVLSQLDQDVVQRQVAEYVPGDVRRLLAAAGLREEHLFPVPAVLELKPSLIGYYRLLLGAPQKTFYKRSTGMGRFKSMEEHGTISKQKPYMPDFCRAMAQPLAELVRQIPRMTGRDLHELPLLTFGSQFQGSKHVDWQTGHERSLRRRERNRWRACSGS